MKQALATCALCAPIPLYAWMHRETLARGISRFDVVAHIGCDQPATMVPAAIAALSLATGIVLSRHQPRCVPVLLRILVSTFLAVAISGQAIGAAGWVARQSLFKFSVWLETSALVLCATLAWTFARSRRRTPSEAQAVETDDSNILLSKAPRGLRANAWFWIAASGVALLYSRSFGLTAQIGPRAWDGETYHLPVPLQWLATRSLIEPIVVTAALGEDAVIRLAQPGNVHLAMALPLGMNWDALAFMVQAPFVALAAWSLFRLAQSHGASREGSALAALGFVSMPFVAEQAFTPMVDLASGALALAAIAVLSSLGAEDPVDERSRIVFGGLSLGLSLGTKASTWLAVPVVIALGIRLARGNARRLAAFAVAICLPVAFWWIRSWVLLGNPLFPLRIGFSGGHPADGLLPEDLSGYWDKKRMGFSSRLQWLTFPLLDPEHSSETGFGALMAVLIYAGFFALAVVVFKRAGRRSPPNDSSLNTLAMLTIYLLGAFWFLGARTPRFSVPLLGFLAVLGATALEATVLRNTPRFAVHAAVALAPWITFGVGQGLVPTPSYLTRPERLAMEQRVVPAAIDSLTPRVILNDFHEEPESILANYWLFGSDHRHLVYDEAGVRENETAEIFLDKMDRFEINTIFLRHRETEPLPARYVSPRLVLLAEERRSGMRGRLFAIQPQERPRP